MALFTQSSQSAQKYAASNAKVREMGLHLLVGPASLVPVLDAVDELSDSDERVACALSDCCVLSSLADVLLRVRSDEVSEASPDGFPVEPAWE